MAHEGSPTHGARTYERTDERTPTRATRVRRHSRRILIPESRSDMTGEDHGKEGGRKGGRAATVAGKPLGAAALSDVDQIDD